MAKLALSAVIISVIVVCIWLVQWMHLEEEHVSIIGGTIGKQYYSMDADGKGRENVKFDLLDPECAPEDQLNKIMYGYHIMLDTRDHLPEYTGNSLNCNDCHFNGGNTLGGRNRGISLVGVTETYPKFSKRDNKNITLKDRLENCFKRSMNGKPVPEDSLEMEAIVAYLSWISHEVRGVKSFPWLGLKQLSSDHKPNAENGKIVYEQQCSVCHGKDGEGSLHVPPLWGNDSFNDGAGMNTMTMLSSFVYQNMPYGQPGLSQEDALDVAAYVISRPRPHFKKDER